MMETVTRIPKLLVRDLAEGDKLETTFSCQQKELRQGKNGNTYLFLTLADKSGELPAFVWEDAAKLAGKFERGDVLVIRGAVQVYQDRPQIVVHKLRKAEEGEWATEDFVLRVVEHPERLLGQLRATVASLENPWIRGLLETVLGDAELMARFQVAPAAKTMHHAYPGGLIEHVTSVVGLADLVSRHYTDVDRSRMVFGALMHDFGKVWELSDQGPAGYTDEGKLIGHLVIETLYVDRLIAAIPDFPGDLRLELLHILLSHHGQYEYGSPKRPKTKEALLVHHLDDMDSKLQGMREALARAAPQDRWSPFSRILERNVFRGGDEPKRPE